MSGVLVVGLVHALDAPTASAIAPWSQFGLDATHTGAATTGTALTASTVD